MRRLIPAAILMLITGPARAIDHPCAIGVERTGELASVGRGDTFQLLGSSQKYALADIVAAEIGESPEIPGGPLRLYVADSQGDLYGRLSAHLFHRGQWVQGKLLKQGRALAYAMGDSSACRKALLDAETQNTERRSNYWQVKGVEFRAADLDLLSEKLGHFVLVTGRVLSVGDRERRLYLNFGENWAHDFTVSVAKQGAGKFKGNLSSLTNLKGRKVQVRGVLEYNRGPLIRVVDEIQIKVVK
ncbi:MAG: hypothetical protein ABJM29_12165 [Rhizobiaceae bacterium]